MTTVPLINYPGYNKGLYIASVDDSGVASECDSSLDNPSTFTHSSGIIIDHDPGSIAVSQSVKLPGSEISTFVDTTTSTRGRPIDVATSLRLPKVVTILRDVPPKHEGSINPLLDNCYQRAIARAKDRLLKGEILDKNGEWRIPGAPVPSRPDYSKVKPTKDKYKHRRRKAKHQRSETYPQEVLKDKQGYENIASNAKYREPISSEKNRLNYSNNLAASQRATVLLSEIGTDYIGRSYVQFTGTAALCPKYLTAVDIRTRNEEKPHFCYGCRSNVAGYDEEALTGLYNSVLGGQECHHNVHDSLKHEESIKYDGDVAHDRSTTNDKTSQIKNAKYRRAGGGFLFSETERKSGHNSLPKWARFGAVKDVCDESVLFNVDKLQEPDGPVYQPTIPRDTRSPAPQFIRDRQLNRPDLAKPKLYEPAMKYMNQHNDCATDGGSSMTSGLGTSINSEVLKRQAEEEECDARLKAEEEKKARQEAKRKAEEEEKRRKEELRKELYKPPNPFKLKANDTNTTVSTDPFSKNRSFDIPQPKDIDIKKSSKSVTKPQEFKRGDSNWKEPKKFELKKDKHEQITQFWEAPKRTEKPNSSTMPPKPETVRPESPPKAPIPSPVSVVVEEEVVEEKPIIEEDEEEKEHVSETVESEEETPPEPFVVDEPDVVHESSPAPVQSIPEPEEEEVIEVQKPELETRELSPSPMSASPPRQEPSATTPIESVPNSPSRSLTSDIELPTIRKPTPEPTPPPENDPKPTKEPTPLPAREQIPPPPKEPMPPPPREPTPPPPPKEPTPPPPNEPTPPPPREPTPPPPREPTQNPPPLPPIEEANPIIQQLKKPEKKLKLKRLQPPKPRKPKTKERQKNPSESPDLEPIVKQPKQPKRPKHQPKKVRTIKLHERRKQEIFELPILQPKEPVPVSPEPEPPPEPEPEPLVLPSLPVPEPVPVVKPKEQPSPVPTSPIALPTPPPPRRDPIIWNRKIRKLKPKWKKANAIVPPDSPEPIVRDPLDYLAKYCIVHKNRVVFYERVFSKLTESKRENDDEYDVLNESSVVDDAIDEGNEFQNTFGRSAKSPDADEYISPKDIAMEDADNRQTTKSPTSDLDSSTHSPRLEATGDSIQIQHRLDKLSFILENVYSKIEKLRVQIHEYEEQHEEGVKILARAELERVMRERADGSKQNKARKKKKGKGKGKKSAKQDNSPSTITVGGTPRGTPRATPRGSPAQLDVVDPNQLTDDQIIARISSAQIRMIKDDPSIRKIELAKTRTNEKLEDMEKWISELKDESSIMTAQVIEQKRREEDNRPAVNQEFRREQSGLYKKMNPFEEHNIQMTDMEPLLRQINGQLITKKECQYVYHVLNLPQRHKLNFKLFTIVAALSEKVSRLEPFVKKMINKMDFEALDVKMQRAKELFRLLEDECDETYPGEVTIDSLAVDLQAGGLSKDNIEFVVNKFGREGSGIVDFLDFLTYLPLFIDIHGNIVNDPLNRGEMSV